MSVAISIPASNFTEFVDTVNPPNLDAASYYGLYGTDAATTRKNLAGGADATILGAPTYGAGFATFSNYSKGLNTGVVGGNPFTHLLISARPSAGSASGSGMMGHWLQATSSERMDILYDLAPASNAWALYIENVAGQLNGLGGVAGQLNNYNFLVAQYDGATMTIGIGETDGNGIPSIRKISGAYTDPTPAATRSLYICAMGAGSADSNVNVAMAMEVPAILTIDQITAEYAFHKKLQAARGITLN